MLELYAKVTKGCLKFHPPNDELYMRWLNVSEGKSVTVRLSRRGPMKTNKQLGAYFGLAIARIREAMIDKGWTICGVAPNIQMIHEILSMSCGGVGPMGETLRVSQMTIDQMMQFFENVRDWAATQLNVYIPDPDPNWRNHEHNRTDQKIPQRNT